MKHILLFSSSIVSHLRCPWDGRSSKNGQVRVPAMIMYTTLNLRVRAIIGSIIFGDEISSYNIY